LLGENFSIVITNRRLQTLTNNCKRLFIAFIFELAAILKTTIKQQATMVTSNILQRTFLIKYHINIGTAFTIEKKDKQFLVSTKHTFFFCKSGDEVKFNIKRNNEWNEVTARIYFHKSNSVDIALLELAHDISPRHPINIGTKGIILSQDAFFIGYPYGRFMEDTGYINNGFPIPFVKKGIFSTIPFSTGDNQIFFLDGINNPGFSGGPCVFTNQDKQTPTVCGVVKGYLPHEIDVKTQLGNYTIEENSGLVEVHSIDFINEIDTE